MQYNDLREFIAILEKAGELKQIETPVSVSLELTALADRVLRQSGPALLLNQARDVSGRAAKMPVLANLFGTTRRVAMAMGHEDPTMLREIGRLLAYLKEPDPPRGLRDAWDKLPVLRQVLSMAPKEISRAPCQAVVLEGSEIDLAEIPVQHCWPGDVAPLITWGLVVTRGPHKSRQNLGIYRQQVLNKHQTIMRWLSHRGGALDFRDHVEQQRAAGGEAQPFPIAVVLGADPATILGAVTPIPDSLSEYQFAGLLRGARTTLARCIGSSLQVPASAEIVLEGHLRPDPDGRLSRAHEAAARERLPVGAELPACPANGWEMAPEGPYGDHTGYYNEVDWFPVFTIERITMRERPIYHTTYTGRPPDEPAMLGLALNEVFVPILQKQFPEIVDFYLPAEGCSYRLAVVSIRKQYAGHAKRVMFGIWSFLRQFMYTKFIIVTDDDIDVRDWQSVIWAMTTRVDPARDSTIVTDTPIDYLDFASPVSGLGGKIGIDATNKWPGETQREWGRPIAIDAALEQRVDELMRSTGLAAG